MAIAYGVDFGTTNSSIAIAYPDSIELVRVTTRSQPYLLPSVIYLHRGGGRSAGDEAIQQYLVTGAHRTKCFGCDLVERNRGEVFTGCMQYSGGGFCQDSRIAAELKSELASPLFEKTHSWALDFTLPDLVAIILRALKRAADRAAGADVRRAVIGYPVAFVGAEGLEFSARQALALDRLKQAARAAGLEEVEFLQEPAAVVVDEQLDRGLVLVVDFGGGTFDVAVVNLSPEQGEVLALQGAAIGGERFTAALFDAKVTPSLGLDSAHGSLPAWIRQYFRTLGGTMHLLSNRQVPGILRAAQSGPSANLAKFMEEILFGGHAYAFHQAIEQAKINLSSIPRSSIDFHRPGIDLSVPVTRLEFEALIANDLNIVRRQILAALDQAGATPNDVDLVLRTGGSASIPAFLKILDDMFGAHKIHERPPFTAIVHGLAAYARSRWS